MNTTRSYNREVLGCKVQLTVDDGDHFGLDEGQLGEAFYVFDSATAEQLADKTLTLYTYSGTPLKPMSLADSVKEFGGEPWQPGEPLRLSVDYGIAAVALLLDRGEEFAYTVELGESSSDFWAFHDLNHALEDCSGDWKQGRADFPAPRSGSEDRANREGARLAIRAGVPLDSVLADLVTLREPFRERFGEDSSALEDLLDSHIEAETEEVEQALELLASSALEAEPDDENARQELAWSLAESCSLHSNKPGTVLAALSEYLTDAQDIAGPGAPLDSLAFAVFETALSRRIRELSQEQEQEQEQGTADETL